MLRRTASILPGVRMVNLLHVARAFEVLMYFHSRKPANINVKKHAKKVKIQMQKRKTTTS